MVYQTGQSGNLNGRPKGSLNKRTHLAKLLEPHAQALVDKTIELALTGDVNALRLCMERLIPKLVREPIDLCLPKKFNTEQMLKFKAEVLQAMLDGRINVDDAEKLIKLVQEQADSYSRKKPETTKLPFDPIEASRMYQQLMNKQDELYNS